MVRSRPAGQDNQPPQDLVVVGKITTVHGVKGWVKIHSFTEPESNIFDYQPWWVSMPSGLCRLKVDHFQGLNKGYLAHIEGVDDRDKARAYCKLEIQVSATAFPETEDNAVYWHQLVGMRVISCYQGQETDLGTVKDLLETGANDVLIVSGDNQSIDRRERLIPYVDAFVKTVDITDQVIAVDWDPAFE